MDALAGWAPDPVEVSGRLERWPVEAAAALLDQPPPGAVVPPLWHGFHLLDHPAQAELGEDGHPAAGRFLPPLPHRRRMVAGGRLEVREPLRVGDEVVRRSALVAATPKTGRSGDMLLVTVRHEYRRDGAVAVVEEQDLAYRSQPPGASRGTPTSTGPTSTGPTSTGPTPHRAGPLDWRIELHPDPALLFRFSALTHNAHRIHYDHPYVTAVEGYPGLVVHGPLLALLLLELPRRCAPDRRVIAFSHRLRRPVFAGSPVVAEGDAGGELVAGVPGEPPAITGTVTFAA